MDIKKKFIGKIFETAFGQDYSYITEIIETNDSRFFIPASDRVPHKLKEIKREDFTIEF